MNYSIGILDGIQRADKTKRPKPKPELKKLKLNQASNKPYKLKTDMSGICLVPCRNQQCNAGYDKTVTRHLPPCDTQCHATPCNAVYPDGFPRNSDEIREKNAQHQTKMPTLPLIPYSLAFITQLSVSPHLRRHYHQPISISYSPPLTNELIPIHSRPRISCTRLATSGLPS